MEDPLEKKLVQSTTVPTLRIKREQKKKETHGLQRVSGTVEYLRPVIVGTIQEQKKGGYTLLWSVLSLSVVFLG